MKTKAFRADKINVITLGCSKNLVDSENLITQLRGNDYEVTHEKDESDARSVRNTDVSKRQIDLGTK